MYNAAFIIERNTLKYKIPYIAQYSQSRRLVYLDNHLWAEMKLSAALVYLTVLLLSQQLSSCEALRVAAFNIQGFGVVKSKNPTLMRHLTTVWMHG